VEPVLSTATMLDLLNLSYFPALTYTDAKKDLLFFFAGRVWCFHTTNLKLVPPGHSWGNFRNKTRSMEIPSWEYFLTKSHNFESIYSEFKCFFYQQR
jgi:hypothetical protein